MARQIETRTQNARDSVTERVYRDVVNLEILVLTGHKFCPEDRNSMDCFIQN
jgi:hypothetical protein